MSGKMLCGRDHACCLRAFREGRGETSDVSRVFSIRANIDHWIGRIVVYVNDWREDLMHTECARFPCGYLTLASRIFRITGRSNRHVPGKVDGIVKTHSRSSLEIGRDEQRITRQLLHSIREHHRLVNRSTKKNEATHFVVFDVMF